MTIAEAEARKALARQRLSATVAALRERTAPRAIARDLGERGAVIADRNAATIGAVAFAAMLLLARHRIAAAFTTKRRRK